MGATTVTEATETCPNKYCNDAFVDLPKAKRIRVFGAVPGGTCLVEFPANAEGFLVFDGKGGGTVTKRPCVPIPVSNTYAADLDTGEVLLDDDSNPIKAPHTGWRYAIGTTEEGCQNRLEGLNGIPANYHWDGCKFVFKPTESSFQFQFEDVDQFTGWCDTYEAVWRKQNICDPVKGRIDVMTLGLRPKPGQPHGAMQMFGGAAAGIPDGWLLCDGRILSATDYPELFTAIGYANGGSGSTFSLPDMRGMFPRGVDSGRGKDKDASSRASAAAGGSAGDAAGSVQDDAVQCHIHNVDGTLDLAAHFDRGEESTTTGSLGSEAAWGSELNHGTFTEPIIFDTETLSVTEGAMEECAGGDAIKTSLFETRPKNVSVHFIIFAGCKACN